MIVRAWNSSLSFIKLEERVRQQSAALLALQAKTENLTERVIRLEARIEFMSVNDGRKRHD